MLLFSALFAVSAAGNGSAASSGAIRAGEASVRLLASGLNDTNSAPVFRGGVEIVLTPGWKTYWRYPGDAGIPPRFDWSGSENVASVEVFYPAPKRIVDGSGQSSIGYEERVIFPLRIHPKDSAKPVVLHLKLDFATCEKLCIPAEATLSLTIKAGDGDEPLLASAEQRVPVLQDSSKPRSLAVLAAKVERGTDPSGKDSRIIVKALARTVGKLDLFAEGPDEEWTFALPTLISNEAGHVTFAIPLEGARLGKAEVPPKIRLTLVAGEEAIEAILPLQ
ncbi:MAG TPA: protein-disulfide reductase DsbD family protein [Xanthobacteraceae bacterium]|nr:protein-disulfide reductase DsbD family protein [Xanthobacteraceae bacterium]